MASVPPPPGHGRDVSGTARSGEGKGGGQRGATRETPGAAGPQKAKSTAQSIGLKDLEYMADDILQRKQYFKPFQR